MGRADVLVAVACLVAALACSDVSGNRDGAPAGDLCGDGVVAGDEDCDDGNVDDSDACLSDCSFARCGDGFVRTGVEECDDDSESCVACLDCDPGDTVEASYAWAENQHCYTAVEASVTQGDARLACADDGGQLFDMDSDEERAAVVPALLDTEGDTLVGYWFGLTQVAGYPGDLAEIEAWRWESGATPSYEYWNCCGRSGGGLEPTATAAEPCAELVVGYDDSVGGGLEGLWNDLPCTSSRRFLCERQAMALSPTDNHAYRVHHAPMSWSDAAAFCEDQGGTLASPATDADNAFVAGLLGRAVWIGAYENSFGGYTWRGGEPFDFDAWAEGEPAIAGGCATSAPGGGWRAQSCDELLPFVCEHL